MLWNTISSLRGRPERLPVVVMSMVWPRSSAARIASGVAVMHPLIGGPPHLLHDHVARWLQRRPKREPVLVGGGLRAFQGGRVNLVLLDERAFAVAPST